MGCDYYVAVMLPLDVKHNTEVKSLQAKIRGIPAYNENGEPVLVSTMVERTVVFYNNTQLLSKEEDENPAWYVEEASIGLYKDSTYPSLWLCLDEGWIGFSGDSFKLKDVELARDVIIKSMKSLFNIEVKAEDVIVGIHVSC